MIPDPFPSLPGDARLWLLALEADPGPGSLAPLLAGLEEVLGQWRHKGHAYHGACALLEGRILAVAEPDLAGNPSGCAIDGMLRKVQRLAAAQGLAFVDPATSVLVRTPAGLRAVPKNALAELLARGELGPATGVLDLALYSVGDLREGKLEAPLGRTWIGRKFKIAS